MNTVEIVGRFRALSKDTATPYRCDDTLALAWAVEAEEQAAIRSRLLRDDRTIELSTPDAPTLEETTGSLSSASYSYRVSALNDSGETEASTATALAVGASAGVTVSWTAIDGATGYKIYGNSAGSELLMATVDEGTTEWTDDGTVTPAGALPAANTTEDVVKVSITSGRKYYPVHESIIEIESARLTDGSSTIYLDQTTRQQQNLDDEEWRTAETTVSKFIHDDGRILFNAPIDQDWTMMMDVIRKPLVPMASVSASVSPEIDVVHHHHLVDWMLKRYYMIRDADVFNPEKSKEHEVEFTNYFGLPVDANMMKSVRANRPHRNKLW